MSASALHAIAFFRGGSKNMRFLAQHRTIERSIFCSLPYQISIHISVPGLA
jgi:hypothetical protein